MAGFFWVSPIALLRVVGGDTSTALGCGLCTEQSEVSIAMVRVFTHQS